MAQEDPRAREEDSDPPRVLRAIEGLGPGCAPLLLFCLAFFPAGLGAVGAAVAYELVGSLWAAGCGALGGACVGLLGARDFLHWRLRVPTVVGALLLGVLFALAYT